MSSIPEIAGLEQITSYLRLVDGRLRTQEVLRGVGRGIIFCCSFILLALLADYLIVLPAYFRVCLLTGFVVAGLYFCWTLILVPLWRKRPDNELAWYLDRAYPNLSEGVSAFVEFDQMLKQNELQQQSRLMVELSANRTTNKLESETISIPDIIPADVMWKSLWIALGMTILLLFPALFFRQHYQQLMQRLFTPLTNVGTVTNLQFEVSPGDTVIPRHQHLQIDIKPVWTLQEAQVKSDVLVEIVQHSGKTLTRKADYVPATDTYQVYLPTLTESLSYRILCGRSASRDFVVEVIDPSLITSQSLELSPPAYTGIKSTAYPVIPQQLTLFQGSQLNYEIKLNNPVECVELALIKSHARSTHNLSTPTTENVAADKVQAESFVFVMSNDHQMASISLKPQISGEYGIVIKEKSGYKQQPQLIHIMSIDADQPPVLKVFGKQEGIRVRKTDDVRVRLLATDDVAVTELELVLEATNQKEPILRIPAPGSVLGTTDIEHTFVIPLKEIIINQGEVLTYRVRAKDSCEVPAPHEVWSDHFPIVIDDEHGSAALEEIKQSQDQVRAKLKELVQDTEHERSELVGLEERMRTAIQADKEFQDQETLQTVNKELKQTISELQELSQVVSQQPLYASLKQPLKELAEQEIQTAWQKTETINPQQKVEAEKQLAAATEAATKANQKLNKLLEQFEQIAALEQDLAQLEDLAQDARRLSEESNLLDRMEQEMARQQQDQNQPEAGINPDTQPQSEQIKQEQAELDKEVNQLSQKLDKLLDQRPELVQAARDFQLDRLAKLADLARQLAEREKKLADSVDQSQKERQQDLSPLIKEAEELAGKNRELNHETQKMSQQQDIQALDTKPLENAIEAMKRGEQGVTEQQLQQAMQDMQQLKEALNQEQALSNKPDERLKQLAERQQEVKTAIDELQKSEAKKSEESQPEKSTEQAEKLRKLAAEQAAIATALAHTPLNERLKTPQEKILNSMQEAIKDLEQQNLQEARDAAQQNEIRLKELAQQVEQQQKKMQAPIDEVNKLLKDQEKLAQNAQAIQDDKNLNEEQTNKKLDELAKQQEKIASKVGKLETPMESPVQDQAKKSAEAAQQAMHDNKSDEAVNKAKEAAEQLKQLASELTQQDEEAQKKNQLPNSTPQELANQLQDIQQKQAELNQQTAAKANQNDAKKEKDNLAGKQSDLDQQLDKLKPNVAQQEIARAENNMEQAQKSLQQGDYEAAQAQQAEAMHDLQRAIEQANREAQGVKPEEQQQVAEKADKAQEQLQQLMSKLNPDQQQAADKNVEAANQPASNPQTAENNTPTAEANETSKQPPAGEINQATTKEQVAEALQKQREITRQAAELAVKTARETGTESPETKNLKQMAKQSSEASQAAEVGKFKEAQEAGEQSAESAESAQKGLVGDETESGLRKQKLADEAKQLAQEQQEVNDLLNQLAQKEDGVSAAQQQTQSMLGEMTNRIEEALGDIQGELVKQPINDNKTSQNTAQTKQTANEAAGEMQQAEQAMSNNNQGTAAESTRNAAELLEQLATQAQLTAGRPSSSPVPDAAGNQVAEANQQLKNAQQMAAQRGQQSQGKSGQQGKPGQQGQQGEPGEQSMSEALENTAQALQNALAQLQNDPSKNSNSQMSGESEGQESQGDNTGESQAGDGTGRKNPFVDLRTIDAKFNGLTNRNWGKLPGQLESDILQSTRKKPHAEYSRQVKKYFEKLATGEQQETDEISAQEKLSRQRGED